MFKVVCITNEKTVLIPASYSLYFFPGVLIQQSFFQILLNVWKVRFRMQSGRFVSYSKRRNISQNDHSVFSLSFVVTLCHSLLLVVSRFPTHYHSLYHLLSFVVTRCSSCCYLLSLDVSLVCRFINAHFVAIERHICFSFLYFPWKYVESLWFLETIQCHWGFIC